MTTADCPTTGKPGYTHAVAKQKAKRASKRYEEALSAYLCPECGAWHFGHTIKREKPLRLIHRFHELREHHDTYHPA